MHTMYVDIRIQKEIFDITDVTEQLRNHTSNIGAIVTFFGIVREYSHDERIEAIELEHYPEMTEQKIEQRIKQAQNRFALQAVSVIHRVGLLCAADPIVLIAVASEHRKEAFAACQYLMDYLKNEVPIWKKEHTAKAQRWVAQKAQDADALKTWQ